MMKGLVKYAEGPGNLALHDVHEPVPGSGEVKIKVEAASICGSDLHIKKWDIGIPMRVPVILGHEFSGVVAETGDGAEIFQPGDRVTGENTRSACGLCPQCVTGSYNLCKSRLATGYAYDGAFAGFVVVPEKRVHKLPENVDFISGALTDPSACAYHAVQELTGIDAGDVVLITGPGAMGLFSLQYVKINGGTVVMAGTQKDAKRLELAAGLGADHVVTGDDTEKKVMELTSGSGADVVIECSGSASAAAMCLKLLRREGKYTQLGIFGAPVAFDLDQILYKEARLIGSFSQKYSGWKKALELCSAGKIAVSPLVTHKFALNEWEEAFRVFEDGSAVKVVFEIPNL